jgi:hypothetical protein
VAGAIQQVAVAAQADIEHLLELLEAEHLLKRLLRYK